MLVVLSAVAFSVMAILAKGAEGAQVNVGTILAGRFVLAAVLFWLLAAARGVRLRAIPLRPALSVLALGACVYAVESTVYFSALTHIDASIASLLLCTWPGLVLVMGVVLRRERADARRLGALGLVLAGALLVLAGNAAGAVDATGVVLAFAATVLYAGYVTVADRAGAGLDPVVFGALLTTGAGTALTLAGTADGHLHPAVFAHGDVLLNVALMATVSTVFAVTAFYAGMQRLGAGSASIIAGIEPAFTVGLAAVLLGESLTATQVAGGIVVLAAVLLVRGPAPDSLPEDGAPALPAPVAPARALSVSAA